MDNDKAKIKIRIGEIEIEIEGNEEYVKTISGENIFDFIKKIQKLEIIEAEKIKEDKIINDKKINNYPKISAVKGPQDAVFKLFKTNWGKIPKSLNEIMDALDHNSCYYKRDAISTTLIRLTKKREIRRVGERGSYKWIRSEQSDNKEGGYI